MVLQLHHISCLGCWKGLSHVKGGMCGYPYQTLFLTATSKRSVWDYPDVSCRAGRMQPGRTPCATQMVEAVARPGCENHTLPSRRCLVHCFPVWSQAGHGRAASVVHVAEAGVRKYDKDGVILYGSASCNLNHGKICAYSLFTHRQLLLYDPRMASVLLCCCPVF